MNSTIRMSVVAVAASLLALAIARDGRAGPLYRATNLGTRQAYGLTSSGQVLQMASAPNVWHTKPTIYDAYGPDAGRETPLAMNEAWAVSPNGTVAGLVRQDSDHATGAIGAAAAAGSTPRPFAAEFSGAAGADRIFTTSISGVNDSGQVVGSSDSVAQGDNYPYGPRHALLSGDGVVKDLGTFGGEDSVAMAINASGQVAGWARLESGEQHAFLYSGGKMADLGGLPGFRGSEAFGINDAGAVVGTSEDATHTASFIYKDGVMTDLGSLPGYQSTMVSAINNAGEAVGMLWGSKTERPGDWHGSAFLWKDGVLTDLNTLIPSSSDFHLESAFFINDAGQIVGRGQDARGVSMMYLLTPEGMPVPAAPVLAADEVPEPSTLVLAALLAAAAASRRVVRRFGRSDSGHPTACPADDRPC